MGRKRKDAVKVSLKLSVDKDLVDELNLDGVNKSSLFTMAAKKYLDQKKLENDKKDVE